jgi:hypothetical protein
MGMEGGERDIIKLCPNAKVLSGLAFEAVVWIDRTTMLLTG